MNELETTELNNLVNNNVKKSQIEITENEYSVNNLNNYPIINNQDEGEMKNESNNFEFNPPLNLILVDEEAKSNDEEKSINKRKNLLNLKRSNEIRKKLVSIN